jgi:hypothetical protein
MSGNVHVDYAEDGTIRIWFNTVDQSYTPVAPSAAFTTADFAIHKDGSATQKTAADGLTCTDTFDGKIGLTLLEIDSSNDTNDAGFWAAGAVYMVRFDTAKTVDSVSIDGRVITSFSLDASSLASQTSVDNVKTVVDAVKAKTDQMVFTLANKLNVSVFGYIGTLINESTAGRIAGNIGAFFDNADSSTAKTVDDVGAVAAALSDADVANIVAGVKAVADEVSSPLNSNQIILTEGDHWIQDFTDLGSLVNRTNLVFAIKNNRSDPDSKAVLMVDETTGALRLQGTAYATATDASITVTDVNAGNVRLIVKSPLTKKIHAGQYKDGLKMLRSVANAGDKTFRPKGETRITTGPVDEATP